jgi:hypothetical protein
MRFAIGFDNDLRFQAGQVAKKWSDGMLSAKLEPAESAVAKHSPKSLFRRHILLSQFAGAIDLLPLHAFSA